MKVEGCNAIVHILTAFYLLSANFKEDMPVFIELLIQIGAWKSVFTLPINQFNALGLQKKCPLLRFDGRKAKTALDAALIAELSHGLSIGKVQCGYYIEKTGTTILPSGQICFFRGSELIGMCDRPHILEPQINNMKLLGDGMFPSQLFSLLLSSPLQVMLVFAYIILTSIRSLLIGAGIDLQAILYIVGGQGLGKTTLATRMAGIYEQGRKRIGIVQAGSTLAAVNQLMLTLRDQPIVIDDLCLSASKTTTRKRVELTAQLIRQGTGCIPIIKRCGNSSIDLPCEAGIIMTAEFHLENLSDLTRCFIVPVHNQLDIPSELTSELVGNAVRHYSKWFVDHYQEEINHFHEVVVSKQNNSMDKRILTNYACLEAALQSFVCSVYGHGVSSILLSKILNRMNCAIAEAQRVHQDMIAEIKSRVPVGNLPFCIMEGLSNHAFDLTDNIKKLYKHGGIFWGKDLCLRREELVRFIRQQAGYQDWSPNKISRTLKDIGALVIQEDEAATVHLVDGTPRVYRLHLKVLEKFAEKY